MFYGTLGTWNTTPVDLELKDGVKPVVSRPYPVTKLHESMLRKEVEIILILGVLEKSNDSEWGAPFFAQPKVKTNHVILLSDFWDLNRQLKRNSYSMPKIRENLLNLECFNILCHWNNV